MSEKLNLYQKLHAIMQEMDNIPKTGRHPKQGWAFHRADDIFNGARAAFIKHRVLIVPGCIPEHTNQLIEKTTKGSGNNTYEQTSTRTNIIFTYTFIDIDSGEKLETAWPGESVDYDDKGTQQAGTSSMKYMLMKMFLATPDHDPDYNSVKDAPAQVDTATGEIAEPAPTPKTATSRKEANRVNTGANDKPNGWPPAQTDNVHADDSMYEAPPAAPQPKIRSDGSKLTEEAPAAFVGKIMRDKGVQKAWKSIYEAKATINKMWRDGEIYENQDVADQIMAVIERLKSHQTEAQAEPLKETG